MPVLYKTHHPHPLVIIWKIQTKQKKHKTCDAMKNSEQLQQHA
jgi:hypothetical protein